jgi:hypothetical protein
MCPAGIWIRIDMLPWSLIAAEFHGVSSQTGSIMTTKSEVSVHSDEASAWSTALSMSSSSYSGLAIHEVAQQKRIDFMTAPKVCSSEKAEQYVIPLVVEQLRGLPKICYG